MIRPEHAGVGLLGLLGASVVVALYVKAGWLGLSVVGLAIVVTFCIAWAIGAITMKSWWPFG